MNKNLLSTFRTFLCLVVIMFAGSTYAQPIPSCGTDEPLGTNLICNGDFESGDSCFTTQYTRHSTAPDVGCGTCFRNWSNPNEYEVVTNVVTQFHTGFTSTPTDHTPGSGNHYMAVDGACEVGKKVWCQDVNITPNTNYFFTMWYTSLHSSNPALLQFSINGTNVGEQKQLGAANGAWTEYFFEWSSGATSGTVPICIENMTVTGCGNGNDFAIDDISFTAGCQFGAAGPQPNLGADKSLCLEGSPLTLNSGVTPTATMDITWSTGATGSGMGAPYTIDVSTPGTYSVCVRDAGSCIKSDVVVVNNSYSVNIGPDVVLCNPTIATFDAVIAVGGTTYQWYKDAVAITGATNQSYTVNTPGTYRVEVTVPGCGMQSDEAVVSTQAAIATNAEFCPPAAANLSVTGTGTYEWYENPTGGPVIATGLTYSPTPAGTTTYWVRDASTFSYTFGPSYASPTDTNRSEFPNGFGLGASANEYIRFNADIPFRIDAVTVFGKVYNISESITVSVTLRNSAGTQLAQITRTVIGPPFVPAGNDWRFVIPVGIDVPAGTNYRLSNEGPSVGQIFFAQGGGNSVNWGAYTVPGVASLLGLPTPGYDWCGSGCYGFFYNWEISAGVDCQRVPVIATAYCACVSATPVTTASATPNTFCNDGSVPTITLSVSPDGSGDELVWYSGSCGGTEIARNPNDNDVVIAAPSATTTYFARWESAGCNSECRSVTVTPVSPPTASNAGTNQDICNSTSITNLGANAPSVGTGSWAVVSGTGTVTNLSSPTSSVTGMTNAGDLVLSWTISNGICTPSSSQVTIHKDVLTAPVISGQSFDTCGATTGLDYSTTVDNTPTSTYNWTATGTLNIASQSGNSATVGVGASGGTLQVTETNGACVLSASRAITISPNVSTPSAGIDQFRCVNSAQLSAAAPAVGTGQWSVSAGSGTFINSFDRQTLVTGLSSGINTFTWTIPGCGGPLSADVTVTVGSSSLVLDATGPADTLCIGTSRDMNVSLTGGSGDFDFVWTSSDTSFNLVTRDPVVTVTPNSNTITYYVYANDNFNSGCVSNTDSVVVHALSRQDLFMYNLITPNKDGMNEKFTIIDAVTFQKILPGARLEIYNKWGSRVYQSDDYDNSWDASGIADGVYFYYLKTGCAEEVYRGWIHIISNANQ